MLEFLAANWAELLLATLGLAKVIVNLTPNLEDNRVFSYIDTIVDAVITNHTNNKDNGNP